MYSSICWYSNSPFYCTTLSMTIHQLIKHIKQWSCFIVKLLNSVLLTCGPTAQTLIFSWLPHLGSDTGMTWMSLSNTNTGCSRSAAEVDEHVSWLATEWSRQATDQKQNRLRPLRTAALLFLTTSFMTALNVMGPWYFRHHHTVVIAEMWFLNFTRLQFNARWIKL